MKLQKWVKLRVFLHHLRVENRWRNEKPDSGATLNPWGSHLRKAACNEAYLTLQVHSSPWSFLRHTREAPRLCRAAVGKTLAQRLTNQGPSCSSPSQNPPLVRCKTGMTAHIYAGHCEDVRVCPSEVLAAEPAPGSGLVNASTRGHYGHPWMEHSPGGGGRDAVEGTMAIQTVLSPES